MQFPNESIYSWGSFLQSCWFVKMAFYWELRQVCNWSLFTKGVWFSSSQKCSFHLKRMPAKSLQRVPSLPASGLTPWDVGQRSFWWLQRRICCYCCRIKLESPVLFEPLHLFFISQTRRWTLNLTFAVSLQHFSCQTAKLRIFCIFQQSSALSLRHCHQTSPDGATSGSPVFHHIQC